MNAAAAGPPPRGIWAVASELSSAREAADFAAGAAAWTFRRPRAGDREALAWLRRLRAAAPWLAVHGRSDWALLAQADALIAGAYSLPLELLRALWPRAQMRYGASTHDQRELESAARDGADFVLFGPVFATPAKHGLLAPRGLEALRSACAGATPVIAIGGVLEAWQARACRDQGAHGVAVLRAARDRDLLAALCDAWRE